MHEHKFEVKIDDDGNASLVCGSWSSDRLAEFLLYDMGQHVLETLEKEEQYVIRHRETRLPTRPESSTR